MKYYFREASIKRTAYICLLNTERSPSPYNRTTNSVFLDLQNGGIPGFPYEGCRELFDMDLLWNKAETYCTKKVWNF